jgi:outer membrane protein assembly factor BamB
LLLLTALVSGCRLFESDGTQVAWRQALTNPDGWQGTPAIAGDSVVGLSGNSVVAWDLATGKVRWQTVVKTAPHGAVRRVLISSGRGYVAETEHVVSLSLATGAILWTFTPDAQADQCECAVDDGGLYLGTRSHRVYRLDPATGTVLWMTDIGASWQFFGTVHGVSVSGDTVYAGAEQYLDVNGVHRVGHIVALSRATGAELWRYTGAGVPENVVSGAPRVVGRLLLAPDLSMRGFFAVDRWTGQEVWRFQTSTATFGAVEAPVERDGIVFGATQGGVFAVDLTTGQVKWRREDLVGARDAALCGGVLLIQNQTIQVVDPGSGASITSFLTDPADMPTSGFAVAPDRAVVVGDKAVYGISCAH